MDLLLFPHWWSRTIIHGSPGMAYLQHVTYLPFALTKEMAACPKMCQETWVKVVLVFSTQSIAQVCKVGSLALAQCTGVSSTGVCKQYESRPSGHYLPDPRLWFRSIKCSAHFFPISFFKLEPLPAVFLSHGLTVCHHAGWHLNRSCSMIRDGQISSPGQADVMSGVSCFFFFFFYS